MKKIILVVVCTIFSVLLVGLSSCDSDNGVFKLDFVVDGETYATVRTRGNEMIKIPQNPMKEDFTFEGWYCDKDTYKEPFTAYSLLNTSLSGNMKVYAKWKRDFTEGLQFSLDTDTNTYTVTGYIGSSPIVEIPKKYNNLNVTSIYSCAFSGCTEITSVTISDNIKSIGSSAFLDCTALTEIKFNATAMNDLEANNRVFYNAGHSAEGITVIIGKNVRKIPAFLFCPSYSSSPITSLNAPKITKVVFEEGSSCRSIGASAFEYCVNLTSISIPDSVTSIGYESFYGCMLLESLTIPFVGATKDGEDNTHFGYIFGASSYRENYNRVPSNLKTVIVNGGTRIDTSAFENCDDITNVIISDEVTSIGRYAFYRCSSLNSITIPFVGATKDGTSNTHFGYIFGAGGTISVADSVPASLKTVIITGGTNIDTWAFFNCTNIKSVTIPISVTSIGKYAFDYCTSLTDVYYAGSEEEWKKISISVFDHILLFFIGCLFTKLTLYGIIIKKLF